MRKKYNFCVGLLFRNIIRGWFTELKNLVGLLKSKVLLNATLRKLSCISVLYSTNYTIKEYHILS